MALSAKRKKAIDGYMKGMSKKDALLAAGYSESVSTTRSNDIFEHPEVAAEIERRQKIAAHRADVDMDWIIERLKKVADANIGDMIDVYSDGTGRINLNKMTPELKAAMSSFNVDEYTEGRGDGSKKVKKIKVNTSDKLRALELLIRHLGLSKEKVEVTGEIDLVDRLQRGRLRVGKEED